MGHYRGEMVSEDEDQKAEKARVERLARSATKIQNRINEKGLAAVLAEMVSDPTMFAIRYR